MTITNVSRRSAQALPPPLRIAQAAIHLPEVQEMLRKLSEYKLGVFMPHMHDEVTGDFQPFPGDLTQVEAGLKVSFRSRQGIENEPDRFLAVGWVWRASVATVMACEMIHDERGGETPHYDKHKMARELSALPESV